MLTLLDKVICTVRPLLMLLDSEDASAVARDVFSVGIHSLTRRHGGSAHTYLAYLEA